jgi:hypothetical protein
MNPRRLSVVIGAAALMSAVAGGAWAGDKAGKPVDFTVRTEPLAVAPNSGQALKMDAARGKFGFTVTLQQPGERPMGPNDVAAGAYYRITPSVRVGGSVAFGDQDLTPRANQARPADTPKVRLETAFKF